MKSLFQVNGKPFFSLGGQVSNSSAYTREDLQPAIKAIEQLGMNTIAAPVYWECLEPAQGEFNFDLGDGVIAQERREGVGVAEAGGQLGDPLRLGRAGQELALVVGLDRRQLAAVGTKHP